MSYARLSFCGRWQTTRVYEYRAFVVSVYDGDTITVDIDLGFGAKLEAQKIRLFGIDAPEIRGATRPQGIAARDALRDKIEGMTVTLKTYKDKRGKYGRWLGHVFLGEESVNTWLVNEGYAIEYGN